MDVSRSGRVRKKSSKFADFESPDDVTDISGGPKKKAKTMEEGFTLGGGGMTQTVLAADGSNPNDEFVDLDDIANVKKEDFDAVPNINGY